MEASGSFSAVADKEVDIEFKFLYEIHIKFVEI